MAGPRADDAMVTDDAPGVGGSGVKGRKVQLRRTSVAFRILRKSWKNSWMIWLTFLVVVANAERLGIVVSVDTEEYADMSFASEVDLFGDLVTAVRMANASLVDVALEIHRIENCGDQNEAFLKAPENVDAIVGGTCSRATEGVSYRSFAKKIPQISPKSDSSDFSDKITYPYLSRAVASSLTETYAAAEICAEIKFRSSAT